MEVREYKNRVKYQIIEDGANGDEEAINVIINHYSNYIKKLSVEKMIDGEGHERQAVDVYLSKILELHLVRAVLKFKIS